mgnify:CR=1 FL=1
MGISDKIECFITELLKEEDENDWLELKRNELASFFNCVPSQINYVIATRFNPQHGFIVESRRGGGGYLRIKRVANNNPLSDTITSVGNSLSYPDAEAYVSYLMRTGVLKKENAAIILSGVNDNSLTIPQPDKDRLRANIFKNMLSALQKG